MSDEGRILGGELLDGGFKVRDDSSQFADFSGRRGDRGGMSPWNFPERLRTRGSRRMSSRPLFNTLRIRPVSVRDWRRSVRTCGSGVRCVSGLPSQGVRGRRASRLERGRPWPDCEPKCHVTSLSPSSWVLPFRRRESGRIPRYGGRLPRGLTRAGRVLAAIQHSELLPARGRPWNIGTEQSPAGQPRAESVPGCECGSICGTVGAAAAIVSAGPFPGHCSEA